jgi:hypothetical protein
LIGSLLHPVREAIPAETGQIHQVDILNVGPLAHVLDQPPERRGFEFKTGLVVHLVVHGSTSADSWRFAGT